MIVQTELASVPKGNINVIHLVEKTNNMYEPIVAVDFDGTIVEHAFPEIGAAKYHCIDTLLKWKAMGVKIILWTCRMDHDENQYLTQAVDYLFENGIILNAVNEDVEGVDFRGEGNRDRGKIFANYYIDDKAFGSMFDAIDWEVIDKQLTPILEKSLGIKPKFSTYNDIFQNDR